MRYEFRGLIFGGAYTRRGVFSEFYGIFTPDWLVNRTLRRAMEGRCVGKKSSRISQRFKQILVIRAV